MNRARLFLIMSICIVASGCANETVLSADELRRCSAIGDPITLSRLVSVLRENGVTLDVAERSCALPVGERVSGFTPDATNLGPSEIDKREEVNGIEGDVFCDVYNRGSAREVILQKHPGDQETSVSTLNVTCTVYPSDPSLETRQVERLRRAMSALLRGS